MEIRKVLIVRCGGIGDMFIATPLFPLFKKQGIKTVLYTNDNGAIVFKNNPFVDEYIYHDPKYDKINIKYKKKYDKIYNLHGTLEDFVLFKQENEKYFLPWQERQNDINYYDYVLQHCDLNGFEGALPELYISAQERKWTEKIRAKYRDKFLIMWNPMGSTVNKLILQSQSYIEKLINLYPNLHFIIAGDSRCRNVIINKNPQIEVVAGNWSLRETLIATSVMDLVVAPETAVAHAAACFDVPKIIFLSHSKPRNLTHHWWNVYNIIPNADCHPCYRIPYSDEHECDVKIDSKYLGAKCTFYMDHVKIIKTIVSIIEGRMDRICPACNIKKNKVLNDNTYLCVCGNVFMSNMMN